MSSHSGIEEYVAVSSGTSDADFAKCNQIIGETGVGFICIDVANGYSEHFIDHVRKVRETHDGLTIFAGNVVTGEIVDELQLVGADAIKIGIGPGSVVPLVSKLELGTLSSVLYLKNVQTPHMVWAVMSFLMVDALVLVIIPRHLVPVLILS